MVDKVVSSDLHCSLLLARFSFCFVFCFCFFNENVICFLVIDVGH